MFRSNFVSNNFVCLTGNGIRVYANEQDAIQKVHEPEMPQTVYRVKKMSFLFFVFITCLNKEVSAKRLRSNLLRKWPTGDQEGYLLPGHRAGKLPRFGRFRTRSKTREILNENGWENASESRNLLHEKSTILILRAPISRQESCDKVPHKS